MARRDCRWTAGVRPHRLVSRRHLRSVWPSEARNLAPLPGDVDFTVGASLPISGLTAWQGLFEHGRLQAGRAVPPHGGVRAVGAMVTQLAREFGAYVICTDAAPTVRWRSTSARTSSSTSTNDALEDVGGVDLVSMSSAATSRSRSAGLVQPEDAGDIVGPPEAQPADGWAIDFGFVESDRAQLIEIVRECVIGRLRTNIGNVATPTMPVAALNPTERPKGEDDHQRSSIGTRRQQRPPYGRNGVSSSFLARAGNTEPRRRSPLQ